MMQPRQRKTADERRTEVIAAAIIEFATFGYDGGSTERIAAAAGISQPYVLRLFGSKIGLFLAALDAVCDNVIAVWERVGDDLPADTPIDQHLAALGNAYRQGDLDTNSFRLILQGATASHEPTIREQVNAGMDRIHAWLKRSTGADYGTLQQFWSYGMMITVARALSDSDQNPVGERARLMLMLPAAD